MSLLDRLTCFRDEIAADDDRSPSSIGMRIYRNAYRGRLLSALEASFSQTRRWVGDEPFTAAACHYVLINPPRGWTLDGYGADFPAVLAELFSDDPEVAELAWLEWQLQQAFAAKDLPQLDPAALAAAGYGDAEWSRMRFAMAPGFALRSVTTNCIALWESLGEGHHATVPVEKLSGASVVVWRNGFTPRYRALAAEERDALERIAAGETLGAIAEGTEFTRLGGWLARWLQDNLFCSASLAETIERTTLA